MQPFAGSGFRGSKFTGNQEPSCFDIPIIYMSGYPDEVIKEKAESTAPYVYLAKPLRNIDVTEAIDSILHKKRNA